MPTFAEKWFEQGYKQGYQQGLQIGIQQRFLLEAIDLGLELKFGVAGLCESLEIKKLKI